MIITALAATTALEGLLFAHNLHNERVGNTYYILYMYIVSQLIIGIQSVDNQTY